MDNRDVSNLGEQIRRMVEEVMDSVNMNPHIHVEPPRQEEKVSRSRDRKQKHKFV